MYLRCKTTEVAFDLGNGGGHDGGVGRRGRCRCRVTCADQYAQLWRQTYRCGNRVFGQPDHEYQAARFVADFGFPGGFTLARWYARERAMRGGTTVDVRYQNAGSVALLSMSIARQISSSTATSSRTRAAVSCAMART